MRFIWVSFLGFAILASSVALCQGNANMGIDTVDIVSPSRGTAVDDFDRDGWLEFLNVGVDGNLYLFDRDGQGTFVSHVIATGIGSDYYNGDAASGDLDGDGWPDIVCTNETQNIYLLRNNHDGTFTKDSLITDHPDLMGIDCGDMNGDGYCDIVVGEYSMYSTYGTRVLVYHGDGNWQFVLVATVTPPVAYAEVVTVVVGDFNGDGLMDIVAGQDDDGDPGAAWLFTGDGDTTYTVAGKCYDSNPWDNDGTYDKWGGGLADAYDFDGDSTLELLTGAERHGSEPSLVLFFSGISAGIYTNVDTLLSSPVKMFDHASTPPLGWTKGNRIGVVAAMDTTIAVVVDWSVPIVIIGQPNCLVSVNHNNLFIPIYMNNQDTVKAMDIPLLYDWPFDPDSIVFTSTRVENFQIQIGQIDSANNKIRIGLINSTGPSGPLLLPVDDNSRNMPIAKIMFHLPYQCSQEMIGAPDTCTIVLEGGNTQRLKVVDKRDNGYVPVLERSSTKVLRYKPGDCNGDDNVDISDAVCVISYIFSGGTPACLFACDCNCDGMTDISDAVYLIAYIFSGGPMPGKCFLCGYQPPFAKAIPAAAELTAFAVTSGEAATLTLSISTPVETKGLQLEFETGHDIQITGIQSNIEGMDVVSGTVDGVLKVGLLDMTGNASIPAGQHDFVRISYTGKGEFTLVSAIVVGEDAGKMNVTIKSVGAGATNGTLPSVFALSQNIPNPFNPTTEISYALPNASQVRLEVLNVLGQVVRTLVNEFQSAGNHNAVWDGSDDNNQKVSSGVYFYRIAAGEYAETRKMVLMK